MVVNRGFAINWQNETHQSHRGEMLHRKYPVRVTHCGGSSRKCVSGTESWRERRAFFFLSLSFPLSFSLSPHVGLSRCLSDSFWQALFFLVVFQMRIGCHSLPVSAETDVSKQRWISAFGGYSLLMTRAERLVILNTCFLSSFRHNVTLSVCRASLILTLQETLLFQ